MAKEIANFSPTEQDSYQNSLKYYRDMNNVVNTAREEARKEGIRSLLLRQLSRQLGEIPETARSQIRELSLEALETLGEALFEFSNLDELMAWLNDR